MRSLGRCGGGLRRRGSGKRRRWLERYEFFSVKSKWNRYDKKTAIQDISIRSSAAEYLTFIAATGDDKASVDVRYEDENIWITQKILAVRQLSEIFG